MLTIYTILLKISYFNYQQLNLARQAKAPLENIARIVTETEESIKVNDSHKGKPVFSEVFQIAKARITSFSIRNIRFSHVNAWYVPMVTCIFPFFF